MRLPGLKSRRGFGEAGLLDQRRIQQRGEVLAERMDLGPGGFRARGFRGFGHGGNMG